MSHDTKEKKLFAFEQRPEVQPFKRVEREFPVCRPMDSALRAVDDFLLTILSPDQVETYLQV